MAARLSASSEPVADVATDAASGPDRTTRHGRIEVPRSGRWASEEFVDRHLGHLVDRRGLDLPASSSEYRGGQTAADAALAAFDVSGYAAGQHRAYPMRDRSVSGLSPYIRHGLLSLQRVWDHVDDGPPGDVRAFRGELLWQEYARHRYAAGSRPGSTNIDAESDPGEPPDPHLAQRSNTGRGWNRLMGCVETALEELEEDGWLPNETRRWLANHWTVASGEDPGEGEEYFFRHLLDGGRAANRLGWDAGAGYPFTRWEVEERAAGLCATCELVSACPIERPRDDFDDEAGIGPVPTETGTLQPKRMSDSATVAGPLIPVIAYGVEVEAVWLTAESLGDDDPALIAHPRLPAIFVFDEPLLGRLRLSSKRLAFLVETLADLGTRRPIEVYLGDPVEVLAGVPVAVTHTPVPGWRTRAAALEPAAVYPWRWLRTPAGADLSTFQSWQAAHH